MKKRGQTKESLKIMRQNLTRVSEQYQKKLEERRKYTKQNTEEINRKAREKYHSDEEIRKKKIADVMAARAVRRETAKLSSSRIGFKSKRKKNNPHIYCKYCMRQFPRVIQPREALLDSEFKVAMYTTVDMCRMIGRHPCIATQKWFQGPKPLIPKPTLVVQKSRCYTEDQLFVIYEAFRTTLFSAPLSLADTRIPRLIAEGWERLGLTGIDKTRYTPAVTTGRRLLQATPHKMTPLKSHRRKLLNKGKKVNRKYCPGCDRALLTPILPKLMVIGKDVKYRVWMYRSHELCKLFGKSVRWLIAIFSEEPRFKPVYYTHSQKRMWTYDQVAALTPLASIVPFPTAEAANRLERLLPLGIDVSKYELKKEVTKDGKEITVGYRSQEPFSFKLDNKNRRGRPRKIRNPGVDGDGGNAPKGVDIPGADSESG